jgi:hypothetical protein
MGKLRHREVNSLAYSQIQRWDSSSEAGSRVQALNHWLSLFYFTVAKYLRPGNLLIEVLFGSWILEAEKPKILELASAQYLVRAFVLHPNMVEGFTWWDRASTALLIKLLIQPQGTTLVTPSTCNYLNTIR